MAEQALTVGRIVHYVLRTGPSKGEHRPAIVVRCWSPTSANLQVFTDSDTDQFSNDQLPKTMWVTSVGYDETGKGLHTWHWPERE